MARFLAVLLLCLLACSTPPSWAAAGVSVDSITFAQTADTSGSRAALARELNAGTLAYFASVNEQGGVFGRRVLLRVEDDGYAVERTQRIVAERIRADDVFGFMSLIGTSNALAALPLIDAAKMPLVAPLSGAAALRQAAARHVFHIRASYAREVEKMVEHLKTLGITRVAVFYDDDAFGRDVMQAAEVALKQHGLRAVALGRVERGSSDVAQAVKQIAAAQPQVVICGSFGASLVEFVTRMKRSGERPTFYALSFFTAGASIKQLGEDARGIVVTQVMPNPADIGMPLVREFHALMRKHAPDVAPTPISLEGFVTAKVVVEALKRAGPALTREKFIVAMESLRDVDLGALRLSYSPSQHAGLRYVGISVVGVEGRVLH